MCKAKQGSLSHILAGCNTGSGSALQQGCYTWRHDSILLPLYKQIHSMWNEGKAGLKLGRYRKSSQPNTFKCGSGAAFAAPSISQEVVPVFEESDDWVLQFDLNFDGQTKNKPFPAHIAASVLMDSYSQTNSRRLYGWSSHPHGKRTSHNRTHAKNRSITSWRNLYKRRAGLWYRCMLKLAPEASSMTHGAECVKRCA